MPYEHTVFARRGRGRAGGGQRVDPLPYVTACIIHAGPYSFRDVSRREIADGIERSKGPLATSRSRESFFRGAQNRLERRGSSDVTRAAEQKKNRIRIRCMNRRIGECDALHAYRSARRRFFLPQTISAVPRARGMRVIQRGDLTLSPKCRVPRLLDSNGLSGLSNYAGKYRKNPRRQPFRSPNDTAVAATRWSNVPLLSRMFSNR